MSRRPIGVPFKEFHARSLDDVDDELAKTWHFTGRPLEHATQHRHEAKNKNPINGQFSQNAVLPMHLQLLETSSSCSQVGTSAVRKSTRLITDATVEVSRGCLTSLEIKRGIFSLHPATASKGRWTKGRLKWNEQTNKRTNVWASSWTNNISAPLLDLQRINWFQLKLSISLVALVPENLSTSALLQHFVPAPTHHRCKLCSPIPRIGSRDSWMGKCLILSESTSIPYCCRTKPWQCPTHDILFPDFSWFPLLHERMEWVRRTVPKPTFWFVHPVLNLQLRPSKSKGICPDRSSSSAHSSSCGLSRGLSCPPDQHQPGWS